MIGGEMGEYFEHKISYIITTTDQGGLPSSINGEIDLISNNGDGMNVVAVGRRILDRVSPDLVDKVGVNEDLTYRFLEVRQLTEDEVTERREMLTKNSERIRELTYGSKDGGGNIVDLIGKASVEINMTDD